MKIFLYLIFALISLIITYNLDAICQVDETLPEEESTRLEPVVVTGTSFQSLLSEATSEVTIISEQEISYQNAASVTELLEQVPGLYVDQPGSRGGISSVYIRGGDPNFTLVLIDGVEVNDPSNSRGGSFDFSTLSTDNIERIEIVKGPLSSVYGSDAISGVINIITKRGSGEAKLSSQISGGRFSQFRDLVSLMGSYGSLDYALSGSYTDEGEQVEGSGFRSPATNFKVGGFIFEDLAVSTSFRYSHIDSRSFPDDSGGPEFAVIRNSEIREVDQFLFGLDIEHEVFSYWEYKIDFGFYSNKEDVVSPGVSPGIRDPFGIPPSTIKNDFKRYRLFFINKFAIYENLDIRAGVDFEYEKGISNGEIFGEVTIPARFNLDRYVLSPLVEIVFEPMDDLLIILGARLDFPKDFDTEVSPRVGLSYKMPGTGTRVKANFGKGFKLPSFFALGNPIVGNPALLPETSYSLDIGIDQSLFKEIIGFTFTVFYNRFENLVDFDEGPPPVLVNRSKVNVKGFEGYVTFKPFKSLSANGFLNYNNFDVQGTNEPLRNRPMWWGGLSIYFKPVEQVDFFLRGLFVGKVFDSSIPTGDVELNPYTKFDLTVNWKVNKNMDVFINIDNLFDDNYEQFVGFPEPGITPRIGVELSLL